MNQYSNLPKLPKTEAAVNKILSLPIYGELHMEDVDLVCDAIAGFFGKR
jgi:dTDP-4-amino-4,6-dideoxygalactose transaminase